MEPLGARQRFQIIAFDGDRNSGSLPRNMAVRCVFDRCAEYGWRFIATLREGRQPLAWAETVETMMMSPENVSKGTREGEDGTVEQTFRWTRRQNPTPRRRSLQRTPVSPDQSHLALPQPPSPMIWNRWGQSP